MPAFEVVNQSAICFFFDSYDSFDSIILPGFTGARVRAYNEVRDVTVHLKHRCRTFTNSAENDNTYFSQCPSSFDTQKIQRFEKTMNRKHISNMAANRATLQEKPVKRWKPNAE